MDESASLQERLAVYEDELKHMRELFTTWQRTKREKGGEAKVRSAIGLTTTPKFLQFAAEFVQAQREHAASNAATTKHSSGDLDVVALATYGVARHKSSPGLTQIRPVEYDTVLREMKQLKIVGDSANETPIDLTALRSLRVLELQWCDVSTVDGLTSYNTRTTLHTLILQHSLSGVEDLIPVFARDAIAQGQTPKASAAHPDDIGHWSSLTHLVLSYNKLESVSQGMTAFPNIETLNLSHNELTEISNLQNCIRLNILDLSFNRISDMRSLKSALGNVKTLNLASNNISCTDGLGRLYSLEQLDLSHNAISGANEVSRLSGLPMLLSLTLTGNPVNSNPRISALLANPDRPKLVLNGVDIDSYTPPPAGSSTTGFGSSSRDGGKKKKKKARKRTPMIADIADASGDQSSTLSSLRESLARDSLNKASGDESDSDDDLPAELRGDSFQEETDTVDGNDNIDVDVGAEGSDRHANASTEVEDNDLDAIDSAPQRKRTSSSCRSSVDSVGSAKSYRSRRSRRSSAGSRRSRSRSRAGTDDQPLSNLSSVPSVSAGSDKAEDMLTVGAEFAEQITTLRREGGTQWLRILNQIDDGNEASTGDKAKASTTADEASKPSQQRLDEGLPNDLPSGLSMRMAFSNDDDLSEGVDPEKPIITRGTRSSQLSGDGTTDDENAARKPRSGSTGRPPLAPGTSARSNTVGGAVEQDALTTMLQSASSIAAAQQKEQSYPGRERGDSVFQTLAGDADGSDVIDSLNSHEFVVETPNTFGVLEPRMLSVQGHWISEMDLTSGGIVVRRDLRTLNNVATGPNGPQGTEHGVRLEFTFAGTFLSVDYHLEDGDAKNEFVDLLQSTLLVNVKAKAETRETGSVTTKAAAGGNDTPSAPRASVTCLSCNASFEAPESDQQQCKVCHSAFVVATKIEDDSGGAAAVPRSNLSELGSDQIASGRMDNGSGDADDTGSNGLAKTAANAPIPQSPQVRTTGYASSPQASPAKPVQVSARGSISLGQDIPTQPAETDAAIAGSENHLLTHGVEAYLRTYVYLCGDNEQSMRLFHLDYVRFGSKVEEERPAALVITTKNLYILDYAQLHSMNPEKLNAGTKRNERLVLARHPLQELQRVVTAFAFQYFRLEFSSVAAYVFLSRDHERTVKILEIMSKLCQHFRTALPGQAPLQPLAIVNQDVETLKSMQDELELGENTQVQLYATVLQGLSSAQAEGAAESKKKKGYFGAISSIRRVRSVGRVVPRTLIATADHLYLVTEDYCHWPPLYFSVCKPPLTPRFTVKACESISDLVSIDFDKTMPTKLRFHFEHEGGDTPTRGSAAKDNKVSWDIALARGAARKRMLATISELWRDVFHVDLTINSASLYQPVGGPDANGKSSGSGSSKSGGSSEPRSSGLVPAPSSEVIDPDSPFAVSPEADARFRAGLFRKNPKECSRLLLHVPFIARLGKSERERPASVLFTTENVYIFDDSRASGAQAGDFILWGCHPLPSLSALVIGLYFQYLRLEFAKSGSRALRGGEPTSYLFLTRSFKDTFMIVSTLTKYYGALGTALNVCNYDQECLDTLMAMTTPYLPAAPSNVAVYLQVLLDVGATTPGDQFHNRLRSSSGSSIPDATRTLLAPRTLILTEDHLILLHESDSLWVPWSKYPGKSLTSGRPGRQPQHEAQVEKLSDVAWLGVSERVATRLTIAFEHETQATPSSHKESYLPATTFSKWDLHTDCAKGQQRFIDALSQRWNAMFQYDLATRKV